MEQAAAKRIGGKQACTIALFAVIILEIIWLVHECQGDFANGILFYLQAQSNPFVLGFFVLLFSVTYFLGRYAGRDILIRGQNYMWVGFKYGLMASAILIGYLLIAYAAHSILQQALNAIFQLIAAITAPMLGIWLFSARQIKGRV